MSAEQLTTSDRAVLHGTGKQRPGCMTIREWFMSYVEITADCWIWHGTVVTTSRGVQQPWFLFDGKRMAPARAAWLLFNDGNPDILRLQVLHRCPNPLCVRPDHLMLSNLEHRLWLRVEKTEGCWLWKGCTSNGYGRISLDGKLTLVHRVVWELTYGDVPDGLMVLHKCDTRNCVRPEHLFLGTGKDNVQDMIAKKRHYHGDRQWTRKHPERVPRGEQQAHAKLTADMVREIRQRFADGGVSKNALAREYGVCHPTIRRIISRHIWKHI